MINKTRLHKAVSEFLKTSNSSDYTNPEIQRNIENFGVQIDGKETKNRLEWVYPGQTLVIGDWPVRDHGDFDKITILDNTPDFLLIYKPKGVVVESGAGHQNQNLQTWLETKYKHEFYLVHRLDKDTQGLMLVAKSEKSQKFFQDQFRNRTTIKKYLAVVDKPVDNLLIIRNWQSRDKNNPLRQKFFWDPNEALKYDKNSREASSVIRPVCICSETGQTLVEIEIKTGRMHQIRLQCEALRIPLVDDKVYNRDSDQPKNQPGLEKLDLDTVVKNFDETEFVKLRKNIFGDTDYSLLSNYLKIQKPDGEYLEVEYKNIENKNSPDK